MKRSDVDIVVVTNLDREDYGPDDAIAVFLPFVETHYPGKYKLQGRSIGIELSYVDLDLVITAAPTEAVKQALELSAVRAITTLEEAANWRLNEWWIDVERQNEFGAYGRLKKAEAELSSQRPSAIHLRRVVFPAPLGPSSIVQDSGPSASEKKSR